MSHVIRKRGVDTRNFLRKQEFIGLVRECFRKAQQEFPSFTLNMWDVPIVFFARGRTAGWAKYKNVDGSMVYNLEFNINAIQLDWDDMTQDTIPHEIAHIVDRFVNLKSNNHNARWRRIARTLGCTGKRCHSIPTERARKRAPKRRVQYIADCGSEIWVTMTIHNKIQRGQTRRLRSNGSKLTSNHCTGRIKVVG